MNVTIQKGTLGDLDSIVEFQLEMARALFEKAKEKAREEGAAAVRLYVDRHNEKAQAVYNSLGMHECHYLMYELDS